MNQPKKARKILLILADSITSDVVLNNGLFNTRSITVSNIKNSQEINRLMQPCNFKIQSITNLYYIARDQSADAVSQCNINRDGTY
jgi:hypothetical protein